MLVAQFIAGTQTGEIDSADRLEDFFDFVAVGFRPRVDHLALDQFLKQMQTHHFSLMASHRSRPTSATTLTLTALSN